MSSSSPAPLAALDTTTQEVAAHLGEDVVVACPMGRRGMMANKMANQAGGLFGRAISKQVHKQRAGGLPEKFMLAVTSDEIVIVAYTLKGRKHERVLGEVAARYPRAGTRASAQQVQKYLLHLDLVPAGAEELKLSLGNWDGAPAFVALLNGEDR